MKKTLLLFCVLLNITFAYSQDFEGVVKYEMSYITKTDLFSVEFMENEFGKTSITHIKNGFYAEFTDSKFISYQLFRHDKKRIYFKHKMKDDTLRYSSTISKIKTDFTYTIHHATDTILNVICDKLVCKDNSGTKTYYYSSEYSLDPEFYKNYSISNKYEILKLMKSIYLKLVMEYQDFDVTITAIEIKRKKIPNNIFKIPKHKILIEE